MPERIQDRRNDIARFIDGSHPLLLAAFYGIESKNSCDEAFVPTTSPFAPVIESESVRQLEGMEETSLALDERYGKGMAVELRDGFRMSIPNGDRQLMILVDSRTDPFLAGIIHEAGVRFRAHPDWSDSRRLFEVSALCFGLWGQKRYPLESFGSSRFLLGELMWRTDVRDLECAVMSVSTHVVSSRSGIPVTWHSGHAARFSSYCHGEGPHAWCMLEENGRTSLVDWMNYPPKLTDLFYGARTRDTDALWREFIGTFGRFPEPGTLRYPPNIDEYYDLRSGERPELAVRENASYFTDTGDYLYSARLPFGWSEF